MDIQIEKVGSNERFGLGYIGPVRIGDVYKITARVPLNVHGIELSGRSKRTVRLRSDRAGPGSATRRFMQRVSISSIDTPRGHEPTTQGAGVLILAACDQPYLALYNLTVFIDGGDVYATKAVDGPFTVYNQAGPVIPELQRWSWDTGVLETIVGEVGLQRLQPITQYANVPEGIPELENGEGFVRWWNDNRGTGVLTTNHGDVLVRRDDVQRSVPKTPRRLERYSTVKFENLEPLPEPRGTLTHLAKLVRPRDGGNLATNG